ncbi:MAG: single-stranded-DNA-specific exonuclease RecJ [Oscillospiraceae bacterium]|nr:single-stranded-DNA-specific exonuclease RecJ [Oscillospiraceae bacterium]
MSGGNWSVAGYDRNLAAELLSRGINPLVSVLLASRGVSDSDKIKELMSPSEEDITSPFLMADMAQAAERVRRAISDGEHVAVYGDYDVDGITASCLLAHYLRSKGVSCEVYIPERLEEGYGVNNNALLAISKMGVSLVITVDCGITAAENKRYAASLGMDMVITDHHEVSGEEPEGPVVDPKRPECQSPAKMLAGVGVAFKLVCAVEGEEHTHELLETYGDLAAVGTVADVMPVTGENRILIRRGIELIREGRRVGLAALCQAAGADPARLTAIDVGYVLAPRINAAGRLGGTDTAVRLLMTEDPAEAMSLANQLCELNKERRRIEGNMEAQALKMLSAQPPEGRPIVLAGRDWHQGVAGIVASRMADRFSLPSIMICVKDGVGRGSCRSAGGYNLFEALSDLREYLIGFGGHELAAGITLNEENIPAFRKALGEHYAARAASLPESVLEVDFEVIKPRLLTAANIRALESLEPYGSGNPSPVLCMCGVRVEDAMGLSDGRHSKLWLSKAGTVFEAVFFGRSLSQLGAHKGVEADVAFAPQINEFRGRSTVQLNLCDFVPRGKMQ